MTEYLGWAATAVFVSSYFWTTPDAIKRIQMLGALMWIGYGVLLDAFPVIVANVLVCGAAAWRTATSPVSEARRGAPGALPQSDPQPRQ